MSLSTIRRHEFCNVERPIDETASFLRHSVHHLRLPVDLSDLVALGVRVVRNSAVEDRSARAHKRSYRKAAVNVLLNACSNRFNGQRGHLEAALDTVELVLVIAAYDAVADCPVAVHVPRPFNVRQDCRHKKI